MSRARALVAAVVGLLVIAGGLTVFALSRGALAQAPSPTPIPTERPTPSRTPRATPSPSPTPSPTPAPTPTPNPFDQALLERRVTVLFVGIDANDDRRTRGNVFNTDAMVVASVDADHQDVALVALPRDTVDLPTADGRIWTGKANSIAASIGIEGLRGVLSATYAIPIDHYVAIDMSDFGRLVNAIGGVQVDVEKRLFDPKIGLDLQPGTQVLNGNNALRYVRSRVDTDYGRQRRQQQMVVAVARQLLNPRQEIDLPELIGALASVQTDITLDKLPTFLEIARRSVRAEFTTQVLGPPTFALFEGIENGPRGWVMVPNIPAMRAYVQAVMTD